MTLASPNFARRSRRGVLEQLLCKVCGQVIAFTTPSGVFIRDRQKYVEAKLRLADGSFHVTHGCKSCLHEATPIDTLTRMYWVDMADMKMPVKTVVEALIQLDASQRGIL